MEKPKLESNIEIVLSKEFDDLHNSKFTFLLERKDSKSTIFYPHADTLIDMFSEIQNIESNKLMFINTLKRIISEEIEEYYGSRPQDIYAGMTALTFYTLIKLGYTEEAISALRERTVSSGTILRLLISLLEEPYSYFNIQQLNEIQQIISEIEIENNYSNSIRSNFDNTQGIANSKLIKESYDLVKLPIAASCGASKTT